MDPTWYFQETIKSAFINYLKSLPANPDRTELSSEERQVWLERLKDALSPENLSPNNYLQYCSWNNYFSESEYWGLLFQVHYQETSSDFREGSRMSRNAVFYLEPNFKDPDQSQLYVDRRGITHTVEALSRRQFIKKVQTNDPDPTSKDLPLDPALTESIRFVQEMETDINEAFVSNKHDGSTLYLTCMSREHPSFPAVKDLLERIPGGFGQDLLKDAEKSNDPYLVLPGTSSQLVVALESLMAYHGTAVLARHETYNGTDTPKDLLLKAQRYLFQTSQKVLNLLLKRGYVKDLEFLKRETFGLMFENCIPDLVDWCKTWLHTELTMVYPEGASYLFGVWYPTSDPEAHPLEKSFGAFLPHTAIYDDLLELKIPQPCALKVTSGKAIDQMIEFLQSQLFTEMDLEKSYYETAVEFSHQFYEKFKDHFMGLQDHEMDNLISWEGFCVFARTNNVWDYVKVKLDTYYEAHKHAAKMIPRILEHSKKNHFVTVVYGSFARVIKLDRISATSPGEMVKHLHDRIREWQNNYKLIEDMVANRLALVEGSKRGKVERNLTQEVFQDSKMQGRFWGTLLGDRQMKKHLHDHFEEDLISHFEKMELDLVEIKNEKADDDLWGEYLSFLQGLILYYSKETSKDQDFDPEKDETKKFVESLRDLVIKFHLAP